MKHYTLYVKVEKTIPVEVALAPLTAFVDIDHFVDTVIEAAWPLLDQLPDEAFRDTDEAEGIKILDADGKLVWEHHDHQFPHHDHQEA